MYFIFLTVSCIFGFTHSADKIRLRDIGVLTFHRDVYVASNRGYRIPELSCVGGTAMKYEDYHPRSVQCYNRGFDGRDVQWECKAELDKNVRFGTTMVSCEGYRHPEDEFVLAGSCGLEYELELVDNKRSSSIFTNVPRVPRMSSLIYSTPYIWFFILILLAVAIWYFCLKDVANNIGSRSTWAGSTPVEPVAIPQFPPPSYSETVQNDPRFGEYSSRHRPSAPPPPPDYGWDIPPSSHYAYRPKTQTESTSSGLWNGLAAGAGFLGGYLFGSADRHRTQTVTAGTTSRNGRMYPDLNRTPVTDEFYEQPRPTTSTSSSTVQDDQRDRYVATTFAKTKRR